MKGTSLGIAIASGLFAMVGAGGSANAVELSADGLGQVLIYPYYTVNRNQQTVISVVNVTSAAKAVNVRFLEGYNSRDVLDFTLFLSGFDVWTASVFALADAGLDGDGAAITTADRSCTFPLKSDWTGTLAAGRPYQEFLDYAYTGQRQDTGPTDKARTREGHVEIVQMADLSGALSAAVTHIAGVPANCNAVVAIDPADPRLLPPSGGLFGAAGIVNVPLGTYYAYNADAISGFSAVSLYTDIGETQMLARANTAPGVATARVLDAAGVAYRSDYPATGPFDQAIDAVSAVFMASTLFNEYNADAASGSNTDWVVTFPTKRFYVDPEILGVPPGGAGALPPFRYMFGEPAVGGPFTLNGNGQSCTQVGFLSYDTEEGRPASTGFPPFNVPVPALCTAVNVITMPNVATAPTESVVLGSRLLVHVKPFAAVGWLRLTLDPPTQPHIMRASSDRDVYSGLPATGFQAVNYINGQISPGVLSNLTGAFKHRSLRTCTNARVGSCG